MSVDLSQFEELVESVQTAERGLISAKVMSLACDAADRRAAARANLAVAYKAMADAAPALLAELAAAREHAESLLRNLGEVEEDRIALRARLAAAEAATKPFVDEFVQFTHGLQKNVIEGTRTADARIRTRDFRFSEWAALAAFRATKEGENAG